MNSGPGVMGDAQLAECQGDSMEKRPPSERIAAVIREVEADVAARLTVE
ncbi:hypothetical protein [Paludisphaera rhizosphaerae]|nr:hypothetical protein [Paludisphaera rhizosphaerae]